ncbi:DUF2807 domain-containing protein [Aquimarina sp. 2201CG1-2-11]|uniref:GIN domain-containing protein n=1 Tax=Aquimarina discodermiae TaxID=3231043 RepID=UPI0034623719
MRTFLLLITVFTLGNVFGQKERIKGNKILSTETQELEAFHTIEIYENFEVTLDESNDPYVKIETDSNVHEYIKVEVVDSVLTISSEKDLRRTKALHLDIFYTSDVQKIILHDKVTIKSLSPIETPKLTIETHGNTEAFITADVGQIECITNDKSNVVLHVTGQEASYQINENSKLEGIITADTLKVDAYQKGNVTLEGELKMLLVRVDNNTNFYGEKLKCDMVSISAEGTSDSYILSNQATTIEARDKAEIFLLGESKISINTFTNEVILYKKNIDYTPNKFKL